MTAEQKRARQELIAFDECGKQEAGLATANDNFASPRRRLAACQKQRRTQRFSPSLPLAPVQAHPCTDAACNCELNHLELFYIFHLGSPSQSVNYKKRHQPKALAKVADDKQARLEAKRVETAAEAELLQSLRADQKAQDTAPPPSLASSAMDLLAFAQKLSPSRPRRRRRMPTSMSSIGSREDPIELDSDMSDWSGASVVRAGARDRAPDRDRTSWLIDRDRTSSRGDGSAPGTRAACAGGRDTATTVHAGRVRRAGWVTTVY